MDPITRKETFLAKAGGQDVTTPTPVTREEYFLNEIAKGGGSGGGGVLVVHDADGTLDKTWAEIDAADCVVIRYNDGSRDWRLTEVATGEGKGGVGVWAYMGGAIVAWESETESGYPTRKA